MESHTSLRSAPIVGISRHRLTIDGKGVTTLAVFHGCPLHCRFCMNPHTLSPETICSAYSTEQLYEKVKIDELYFLTTKGGVTFRRGEPYVRSAFIREFLQLCGEDWTLTVETSLNVPRFHLETLFPVINEYIIDIKDMSPSIYKNYNGQDNTCSIGNLQWLVRLGKANHITALIPHIPSSNTQADIDKSIKQLKDLELSRFDLFTYRT